MPPHFDCLTDHAQQRLHLQIACPAWQQGDLTLGPFHLQVEGPERIVILGCSGAGKSSLLRSLAGDSAARRQQVSLQQRHLATYTAAELARRRAVLAQATEVAFPLAVDLVIGLGRVAYQHDPHLSQIVQQAAQLAHASHLLGRHYNQLSGGEKARVHLARIFAQLWDQQHGLILLDEPLTALDPGLQLELLESLHQYAQRRAHALIAVLHDVNQALQYFSRVWLIREGRLLADIPDTANAAATNDMLTWLEQVYGVPWQIARSQNGQPFYACQAPVTPHTSNELYRVA